MKLFIIFLILGVIWLFIKKDDDDNSPYVL